MAVRKSESRVPGGFSKAGDLGQAFVTDDKNYALISHLSSPLRQGLQGSYFKHLKNTYVVFVDVDNVSSEPANYIWNIKFYSSVISGSPTASDLIHEQNYETEFGQFDLDSESEELNLHLQGKDIGRIVVTVQVDGTAQPLQLTQEVTRPDDSIEALFIQQSQDIRPIALGGNPQITRVLTNDYRIYFNDYAQTNPQPRIPVNIVASLIYFVLLKNIENINNGYMLWSSTINDEDGIEDFFLWAWLFGEDDLSNIPVGISQLIPHFAGMLLSDDVLIEKENESTEEYFQKIYKEYEYKEKIEQKDGEIIDLLNQIRFPKTNIMLCGKLLEIILLRNDDCRNLSGQNLLQDQRCILTIVTQYFDGLKDVIAEPIPLARKVAASVFKPFIQEIVKTDEPPIFVPVQIINIQVLDIRSGQPIQRAKVKRLRIRRDDRVGIEYGRFYDDQNRERGDDHKFSYDRGLVTDNDGSVLRQAQVALHRLGYLQIAGSANGAWNNETLVAYNTFWNYRYILGDIPFSTPDQNNPPSNALLQYIIDEYNASEETDLQGFLKLRIPQSFIDGYNGSIWIEIGFWEFSIALEALQNQLGLATVPIRRTQNQLEATNFAISWIGDDRPEDNQDLDWANAINLNSNRHFGWRVSNGDLRSNLKIGEHLLLKEVNEEFNSSSRLSSYFHELENPIHFVLFGMQWCQPLIDGVVDNFDGNHRANRNVFLNRFDSPGEWNKSRGMHIVTKHFGSADGTGQYYGYYDRNPFNHQYRGAGRRHDSVDIHSSSDGVTNCYAVHGGVFQNEGGPETGPDNVRIIFNYLSQRKKFQYWHLSSRETINGQIVLAGQIIGETGRAGTTFNDDKEPSHLHLQLTKEPGGNATSVEPNSLLLALDASNAICLPSNRLPLMLPCACHYGPQHPDSPTGCNFARQSIVTSCWAVQKYPEYDFKQVRGLNDEFPERVITNNFNMFACPYIHFNSFPTHNLNIFSIQAHLKFVFANRGRGTIPNQMFFDPGKIDNSLGIAPNNVQINIQAGVNVNIIERDPNLPQVRIEMNSIRGWILNTNEIIDNNGVMQVTLQSILSRQLSRTRIAIGIYRSLAPDLTLDLTDFASNFNIDQALADSLRAQMVTYADV